MKPVEILVEDADYTASVTTDAQNEEEFDFDWSQVEPPVALTELYHVTSNIIIKVVQSSLTNIRNQITAEKERAEQIKLGADRAAQEAQAHAQEQAQEGARYGKGKGRADDASSTLASSIDGRSLASADASIESESSKTQKPGLFGFRRRFHRFVEYKGETSRAGAQRSEPFLTASAATESTSPLSALLYRHRKHSHSSELVDVVECISCLEDIYSKDGVKTTCHTYCKECFVRLVSTAVENEAQWPPKCCLNPVRPRTITKNISGHLLKQYKEKADEFNIPIADRLYCSEPDCGEWLRKVDKATKTGTCSKGHRMCILCRQAAHAAGTPCPQDRDQQMADQLAEDEGWRHCIDCQILVEHREACQHMTCRCGAEFCHVCRSRWRSCSCTMQQLEAHKAAASERRQARLAHEAEEEAWVANTIRLIEENEAAERLKEEQRRARERRQREERRQKEAEERARREAARLAALDAKYQDLRGSLLKLNGTQKNSLINLHVSQRQDHVSQASKEREAFSKTQEMELAALRDSVTLTIKNNALEWDRDYRARVRWERQLEEEYRNALKLFWASRKGGAQQVEVAMRAYMGKNDRRMDSWRRWQERELEQSRFALEDEQGIKEELMENAKVCFNETLAAREIDLRRRHMAEKKWFALVTAERTRLLSEIEMVERENGGVDDHLDTNTEVYEDAVSFVSSD